MQRGLLLLLLVSNAFSCDTFWKMGNTGNSGPTQLLQDIFKITHIKNNNDLESAVKQTRSKWLKPKFMERWHHYDFLNKKQKIELKKLIKNSALTKDKMPKLKHYDTVIFCGGWSSIAQKRIDFLVKLYKQGITFDKFLFLACERNLANGPDEDKKLIPLLRQENIALEEVAMIEYLWLQTDMPQSLKTFPIKLYKAKETSDGFRPTLRDALMVMISNEKITKGENFLLISNNPYICMHEAVARAILSPFEANIEAVGAAMQEESLEDMLDSIARCLHNLLRF